MRLRITAPFATLILALGAGAFLPPAGAAAESPSPIVVAQADPAPAPADSAFSDAQRDEINAMIGAYIAANPGFIRDYLVTNPEVLQDAVAELERRQAADQAVAQANAIAQYQDELVNSPTQVVLGNPDGDVTLVEFFDYNCTYCRQSLPDINQLISDDPNLRVVLKEFPILGQGSVEAAQVAAALNLIDPEAYPAFHQALLGGTVAASTDSALAAAAAAGVDPATLQPHLQDTAVMDVIDETYTVANALGLTGTPSFVLGNEVIVGAVGYDALHEKIESVRECGTTTCADSDPVPTGGVSTPG